jgi:hypothetical protein
VYLVIRLQCKSTDALIESKRLGLWLQQFVIHPGMLLRREIQGGHRVSPFIGIFDAFSATIAANHSPNLFYSGFVFAASHYGLPDLGYIAWSDMVQAVWRIRQILPHSKLLVDIDDGYADTSVACHVTRQLEAMGTAMIMLEDQARPPTLRSPRWKTHFTTYCVHIRAHLFYAKWYKHALGFTSCPAARARQSAANAASCAFTARVCPYHGDPALRAATIADKYAQASGSLGAMAHGARSYGDRPTIKPTARLWASP